MKKSNDIIGNRTRDLSACSAVPQPTAPPAACPIYIFITLRCIYIYIYILMSEYFCSRWEDKTLNRPVAGAAGI